MHHTVPGAEKTHKMHQALHGAEENIVYGTVHGAEKYTTLYIKQMEEIPFPHMGKKITVQEENSEH